MPAVASSSPVVYPPHDPAAPVSINYYAAVDGVPVYVPHISGFSGGDVSWLSVDFEGSVTVAVTALRNVRTVEVLPAGAGVVAELEGNTVTLTITEPARLLLKFDDNLELPFHVFANAPETDVPLPGTPGVHYFGPGEHAPGRIELQSDETLYLAPGALVHGYVHAEDAERITVRGRGILCGSKLERRTLETYAVDNTPRDLLAFHRCADVKVEGITILDSHHWTVVFWQCDRVHVDNIKMFNERRFSTDGINPVSCRDVLIENCFARCKDDCISIKGLDRNYPKNPSAMRNIVVQGCMFWSDNNNAVVLGSETQALSIRDIVFRDLDIVRASNTCGDYAGALAVICLHDSDIAGVRFEDIRIESCTGPYFNVFFCDSIFRIPGARQPGGGVLRDIVFKDIAVQKSPNPRAYLTGYDAKRRIEDVRIENLSIDGHPILSLEAGGIVANEFVDPVEFV